jgi:hypothetical protein
MYCMITSLNTTLKAPLHTLFQLANNAISLRSFWLIVIAGNSYWQQIYCTHACVNIPLRSGAHASFKSLSVKIL